jgi:hypothetical protein
MPGTKDPYQLLRCTTLSLTYMKDNPALRHKLDHNKAASWRLPWMRIPRHGEPNQATDAMLIPTLVTQLGTRLTA